jgi:CelD/BcsL family acetyltransferase involved in cellulose biosynthesis
VNQALRIVVLREVPEDEKLRQQWDALVDRITRPEVFYTYEWALAVQRAYAETLHPLLVWAYDETESLCGVAALAVPQDREASFLCATTGDYCDFIAESHKKPAFIEAVFGELRKLDIQQMALANLPVDSTTLAAMREAAGRHGYSCFARTAYVCAQVSFAKLERDKKGQPYAPGLKRLRRFEKAMGPQAPVRTVHHRSWESVEPFLPEFALAHVGRFLETGRISTLAEGRRRIFLAELAKLLAPHQWLVLSRMTAGEQPVAWHFGFRFHGSWFWYQPTFDSSVEKHWPGFCLLSQVIQDALEDPAMAILDLGLGSEAYKAKFANESRETLYVTMHGSSLRRAQTVLRYRAAEAAKAHPLTEKFAERTRQKIRAVGVRVRERGAKSALVSAMKRATRSIWAQDEVLFFEGPACPDLVAPSPNLRLLPIELRHLARAAMEYRDDESTMQYLLRAAGRLRNPAMKGYILAGEDGRPLHFAWTTAMNGFPCAELNTTLGASDDSVLLFDCWTPSTERGRGHYKDAIEGIGAIVREQGRHPWIFSAAGNSASLRGIERAGFQMRYSIIRRRLLGSERIRNRTIRVSETVATEVSARV